VALTDAELAAEAREGSQAALEQLMVRHERLVYRVCYSYSRNRDDALDLTQEVFVKAFTRIDSFRGSGPFRAWLMRTTHNECLNWTRRRRRDRDAEEFTPELLPPRPPEQEKRVEREQTRAVLEDAMAGLNPRQRFAVSLRYFGQRHLREIAEIMECSEGHVKSLLFRGLRKMRTELAPHGS